MTLSLRGVLLFVAGASLVMSCDASIVVDGEEMCLDDFLKELGEDRSAIEAEAAERGIPASDIIEELYEEASDIVDSIIDCTASEGLKDLADGTDGSYFSVPDSEGVVSKMVEYNEGIEGEELDLVFLIDATGSMSEDIDAVKTKLAEIIKPLEGKNTRLSIGYFRDKNVDPDWYGRNAGDFVAPEDDALTDLLDDTGASGGGDFPESLYDAVDNTLTEMDWQSALRVIVAITDAPPLSGSRSDIEGDDLIEKCITEGVLVVPIHVNLL